MEEERKNNTMRKTNNTNLCEVGEIDDRLDKIEQRLLNIDMALSVLATNMDILKQDFNDKHFKDKQ